ncbi:clan AA aspartic protease [Blastomonas sp.]|uniref:clan AA aspartic protease n=1 Tax=Blastomonas sp. TaxID=1909299 RepID=UPI00406A85C6
MGLVRADIELANARDDALRPMIVNALVDSGALHLCIPQQVADQLDLPVLDRRQVTIADGNSHTVDYVGPIRVRFQNRQCLVGALVLGNETLLGAIPMEDMDVVISPSRQSLTVNPNSPNIAASLAMGFRTSHA